MTDLMTSVIAVFILIKSIENSRFISFLDDWFTLFINPL